MKEKRSKRPLMKVLNAGINVRIKSSDASGKAIKITKMLLAYIMGSCRET